MKPEGGRRVRDNMGYKYQRARTSSKVFRLSSFGRVLEEVENLHPELRAAIEEALKG
jgi:hypothetical protein